MKQAYVRVERLAYGRARAVAVAPGSLAHLPNVPGLALAAADVVHRVRAHGETPGIARRALHSGKRRVTRAVLQNI